ncbi:MAG: MraY family glycosyltransferase [Candidatus Omnitrophica bacterium]|nr:MraY family glycosyltransferase [Candidatus Omnitrophota bacterium]
MNTILFFTIFMMSLTITPLIWLIAITNGFIISRESDNGLREETKPLLGGLAIAASFFAGILILGYPSTSRGETIFLFTGYYKELIGIIWGAILVMASGLWEDFKEMQAGMSFFVNLIASFVVWYSGIMIVVSPNIYVNSLVTVLYILIIIRAFKELDTVDGLCAGVAVVSTLGFFFLAVNSTYIFLLIFSPIVFMSILGFLSYNLYPSRIILGSGGSALLGFLVAVQAVVSSHSAPVPSCAMVFIPLLAVLISFASGLFGGRIKKCLVCSFLRNRGLHPLHIWLALCGLQLFVLIIALSFFR